MGHRLTPHVIETEAQLRDLLGEPSELVRSKMSDRLNPATRRFVELSPFVCLATSAPGGSCDVSPRGDPAGFVRVLDDRTLLVPERPGNRLADSLRNVLGNPRVGLLFLLPGVGDALRVNGRATLTTDPALLADSAVEGKAPKLGILVDVEEAFTHCAKAVIRSELWSPARFVDRSALPSGGEVLRAVLGDEFDAGAYDDARAARYARREGFYLGAKAAGGAGRRVGGGSLTRAARRRGRRHAGGAAAGAPSPGRRVGGGAVTRAARRRGRPAGLRGRRGRRAGRGGAGGSAPRASTSRRCRASRP